MNDLPPVVIDNGSYLIKAGFGGDNEPIAIFPTIVGKPTTFTIMGGMSGKDTYIGDEAIAKRAILNLKYPIEKGIITNWDDMEKIWHHTFYNELRVAPEDYSLTLTDVCWSSIASKEKMTQIIFETFDVPFYCVCDPSVLSLYASGRFSGVSFQSGDQVTSSVTIYEGHPLSDSVSLLDFSGREITEYLMKLFCERGYTKKETRIVNEIKEKLCYVALDFEEEIKKPEKELEKQFELPDGQIITLGNERFRAVEPFFQPSLYYSNDSIQNAIFNSIWKNDGDLTHLFFSNIVISGGSMMIEGIKERIEKELKMLIKNNTLEINVSQSENKYSSWIGGSIYSSLSTFENLCISKEKYDEYGPTIVHKMFF